MKPTPHWSRHLTRPAVLYGLFTLLAASNVFTLVALLMAPDIANLLVHQEDRTYVAYEDRILLLRMEVDRLHSRQYRQEGDLNLQMQELTQQQEFLSEQHRYVRILAERAAELGLSDADQSIAAIESVEGVDETVTGSILNARPLSVDQFASSIAQMMDDSRLALTSISEAAERSTDQILSGLGEIGITPTLLDQSELASGGPFLSPNSISDADSLANQANRVQVALERFGQAREALSSAPIFYPFSSQRRISSAFGNRRDPFRGNAAFHSGLDFPAPQGTSVLSAGQGRVVRASRLGGYGKTIEVDHGGIITRYAHLSSILVSVGQRVVAGQTIGKVGSTGRSTGAHLHFEVRKNDQPQNPSPYLELSQRLSGYLS